MSGPVRVLYLAPVARTPGQLSRYSFLDEEIRALADAGIDAYVLSTTGEPDADRGRLHVRAVPSMSVAEAGRALSFLTRVADVMPPANLMTPRHCLRALHVERIAAEIARRDGIALIHSFFGWPRGFGGALVKRATGVPLVAGIRGADINLKPEIGYGARLVPAFDRAIRKMLKTADVTIYVSEFVKRASEAAGASPAKGHVILKGVRVEAFCQSDERETIRTRLGLGSRPVILAVSGLVRIKGLADVLDALARVAERGYDFDFIVCGDGPERRALGAAAERLGMSERVRFAGRVPRDVIPDYFRAADLFVHGAHIEASGNAILEAMASGLPVVCTDAGGPAEYVADGRTGFVVPVADTTGLAAKIIELLADSNLRTQFGFASRSRAIDQFKYERMIDETLTTYRSLLGPQIVARQGGYAEPASDAPRVAENA